MKHLVVILALLFTIPVFAQEEFLGNSSGLLAEYEYSKIGDLTNVNSFGFNAFFKNGLKAGVSSSVMEGVSFATLSVGGLWGNLQKKERNYFKGFLDVSFSNIESTSVFGLSTGFIHCIHMDSNFPTSLSGLINLRSGNAIVFEGGSQSALDLGFNVNQALFADNSSYPYIGIDAALDLGEFIDELSPLLTYSFRIGFNMSFGDY